MTKSAKEKTDARNPVGCGGKAQQSYLPITLFSLWARVNQEPAAHHEGWMVSGLGNGFPFSSKSVATQKDLLIFW
jgi:hypothetical protein